jgi:hypothetical protein
MDVLKLEAEILIMGKGDNILAFSIVRVLFAHEAKYCNV